MPAAAIPSARSGVAATDVWLQRGDRTVLQGARLDLPRGCVTALIAPSGAGKSTLLRCITRLVDPDRGVITLGGVDVRTLPPRELRRRVGLIAQHAVMLPGSVAANVGHGLPAAERASGRPAEAMQAAGLPGDWSSRTATELSGGEQARVAIARALVLQPEVILCDEPTAALDATTADVVGATLRRLAQGGIGVCVATHDLGFAQRHADRCVHLDGTPATEVPAGAPVDPSTAPTGEPRG